MNLYTKCLSRCKANLNGFYYADYYSCDKTISAKVQNIYILYIYSLLYYLKETESRKKIKEYAKMKQAMKEQLNCFLPLGTDGGCCSWDWHCVGDCDRDWCWPSTGRPIVACRSRGARRQARPSKELGGIVPLCECGQRPRKYTRTIS